MLRGKIMTLVRTIRGAIREHRATWRASPLPRRFGIGAAVAALAMLVTPWPVTTSGTFVAAPSAFELGTAPDAGVVTTVTAREGLHVAAGTPLLRIRNLELERAAINAERLRDSLARRELGARAAGDAAAAERYAAQRRSAEAIASGLAARTAALTLRAVGAGVVVTPRPEELVGRSVRAGDVLLRLASAGPPEARVVLGGSGATLVGPGQPGRLVLDDGRRARGTVASVSPASSESGSGIARVHMGRDDWRPGSTGFARITLHDGTLAMAAWWRLRSGVRSDLLF
jgi:multidrug efflux pump subunit AcrA (membrane-fusion protein)